MHESGMNLCFTHRRDLRVLKWVSVIVRKKTHRFVINTLKQIDENKQLPARYGIDMENNTSTIVHT